MEGSIALYADSAVNLSPTFNTKDEAKIKINSPKKASLYDLKLFAFLAQKYNNNQPLHVFNAFISDKAELEDGRDHDNYNSENDDIEYCLVVVIVNPRTMTLDIVFYELCCIEIISALCCTVINFMFCVVP